MKLIIYLLNLLIFVIIDCPSLKPGDGAMASSRDTGFGTIVTFNCPVGQEFATGRSRITTECLKGGNWSVTYIPKCQGKTVYLPGQFYLSVSFIRMLLN